MSLRRDPPINLANRRVQWLRRAISVDRVSYKDAGTKQT
jgi:hypothetical protein